MDPSLVIIAVLENVMGTRPDLMPKSLLAYEENRKTNLGPTFL